jgi:site-specific recombinase XerD
VAAELWLWKETTRYAAPDDWIFASPRSRGRKPFYPDMVMVKQIRPAALRAGITRRIGWHTFRHTYSTMLIANGENVKVVQELMRHANCGAQHWGLIHRQDSVPSEKHSSGLSN